MAHDCDHSIAYDSDYDIADVVAAAAGVGEAAPAGAMPWHYMLQYAGMACYDTL